MAKYADYEKQIDYLVEIAGIYDGWSIAVLKDGSQVNRWENDEGTGPGPGYERRYIRTQELIMAERRSAGGES